MFSIVDKKTGQWWSSFDTLAEACEAIQSHASNGIFFITIVHDVA